MVKLKHNGPVDMSLMTHPIDLPDISCYYFVLTTLLFGCIELINAEKTELFSKQFRPTQLFLY